MTRRNRRLEPTRAPRMESRFSVRQAQISQQNEIARMCAAMAGTSIEEHRQEIGRLLTSGIYGTLPLTVLIFHRGEGTLNGILQVGLRTHADGCDPSQPVGFVEGWFVYEHFRGQGIGKALMRAAENWARDRGVKKWHPTPGSTTQAQRKPMKLSGFK
jgi:aminoglycoside 6'-N-acetyltransferase I